MLKALAIYSVERNKDALQFKLQHSSIGEESLGFFSTSPLKIIEAHSLAKIPASTLDDTTLRSNPFYFKLENEYQYLMFVPNATHIMAISSRSPLDNAEVFYLFHHMRYTLQFPKATHVTLDKIYKEPLYFSSRDCTMEHVVVKLEELKNIVLTAMDEIQERHRVIEETHEGTLRLRFNAKRHQALAEDLNRCCKIL